MWILRYTYCIFQGHAFVDIVTDKKPYQYCLHCGKVEYFQNHKRIRKDHDLNPGRLIFSEITETDTLAQHTKRSPR